MIYGNVEQNGHNWDKRPAGRLYMCIAPCCGTLKRREGGSRRKEQDLIFWSWWGKKKEALFTGSGGEIEQDAVLAHRPPAETIFLPDEALFMACRSGPYITGAPTYQADAARSEATVPVSDAALIYLRNLLKGCAEIARSSSRFHGEGCEAAEVTEQRR